MAHETNGICGNCGGEFTRLSMKNHLLQCTKRTLKSSGTNQDYYYILVTGLKEKKYWLYINVASSASLKKIDDFLRNIWLECCEHMSSFTINGENFDSSDEDGVSRRMNITVEKALYAGQEFTHVYDFGSTTSLKLKVVSVYSDHKRKSPIELMARNVPPKIECSNCKKNAVYVCNECSYKNKGWLCEKCSADHKCGEEMLSPVVNSPRVGVCGYSG